MSIISLRKNSTVKEVSIMCRLGGSLVLLKISLSVFLLISIFGDITSYSSEIIQNDIEDVDILSSTAVSGKANVLTLLDLSASMQTDFGGVGTGEWDGSDIIEACESFAGGTNTFDRRSFASHCAENVAGTSICGSQVCEIGVCDSQEEFDALVSCVIANQTDPSLLDSASIFTAVCQGPSASDCDRWWERVAAAASLEYGAISPNLTQCPSASSLTCQAAGDPDPGCDTTTDYANFKDCFDDLNSISPSQAQTCTGGILNCSGVAMSGSSRLDLAIDMFLEIFDADNSIESLSCDDSTLNLFDGTSDTIDCMDYLETPFRDVSNIISGASNLPTSPAKNPIDELTSADSDFINLRLRGMKFGGTDSSCTDSSAFEVETSGFSEGVDASGKQQRIRDLWTFYRDSQALGGTPLALALGFDDMNDSTISASNLVVSDALNAFKNELETDSAVECRGQVAVVITDGEDSCSGDCVSPNSIPSSCTGFTTTNANRRSAIQAVSNLRTYYARNPFTNNGQQFKKEIPVFVVGLNIKNEKTQRMLHAMAMAGGTYAGDTLNGIDGGVIQHTGPDGNIIGDIDVASILPSGSSYDVYKDIATAKNIDSNPSNAVLKQCTTPDNASNAKCQFAASTGDVNVFDDTFFTSATPFTPSDPLENFAYLANTPEELLAALKNIFQSAGSAFSGAVGSVPPVSTNAKSPDLRGRIALTLNTPGSDHIWQGRLALYGLVDDPDNFGQQVIIRKPISTNSDLTDSDLVQSHKIFTDAGVLKSAAKSFHWDVGKNLAELSPSSRNLKTVTSTDPTLITSSQNGILKYTSDLISFDKTIPHSAFGISDADVDTTTITSFCNTASTCSTDCSDQTSSACKSCVKDCLRDRVVDFMRGHNEILPVNDPMGIKGFDIGSSCPDPSNPQPTDTYDTCSIKFSSYNSQPVFVGSPPVLFSDIGFANFATSFRNRSAVMYVGSNAGFFEAIHAGNLVDFTDTTLTDSDKKNPFTNIDETFDFYTAGQGREIFGFASPTFHTDSTAISSADTLLNNSSPDYRTGDFKSFVLENTEARSFYDSTPLIADIWIDGFKNGIKAKDAICDPDEAGADTDADLDGVIDPCGKEWHTIAFIANKNGGGSVTALDITNPKCLNEACEHSLDGTVAITNLFADGTTYPSHLWTVFDDDFGNTWSNPNVGKVRMKTENDDGNVTVDRWILFMGAGVDPADTDPTDGVSSGNAFHAIDIASGKVVFKFHPTRDIPSELDMELENARMSNMTCDVAGIPGVFDINSDSYADLVYVGDTCGRLWRFDVSMPLDHDSPSETVSDAGIKSDPFIEAADWTGDIVFCAAADESTCLNTSMSTTQRQPIFFAPTLAFDSNGKKHLVFVTGNRRYPSVETQFGKLYNIIDEYIPAFIAAGSPITTSIKTENDFDSEQIVDIVKQSGVSGQFVVNGDGISDPSNFGEFMIRFPDNLDASDPASVIEDISGEKGIGTPLVINGLILFTTFAPGSSSGSTCGGELGKGRLFAVDFQTGRSALAKVPGASDILKGTKIQKSAAAGVNTSEGIPSELRITRGSGGAPLVSISFTGGPSTQGPKFLIWKLPQMPQETQMLYWEEVI